MSIAEQSKAALRILYNSVGEDVSADCQVSDLVQALGLKGMEKQNLLMFMKDKGWINQRGVEVVALTFEGIAEAKRIG